MDYLILQAEEKLLTVAHFGVSRRSTELVGAAMIELDEERPLADAVRGIAEKMTGSPRVVLCLPPALFAQRSVSLPFKDLRKVREVLPAPGRPVSSPRLSARSRSLWLRCRVCRLTAPYATEVLWHCCRGGG